MQYTYGWNTVKRGQYHCYTTEIAKWAAVAKHDVTACQLNQHGIHNVFNSIETIYKQTATFIQEICTHRFIILFLHPCWRSTLLHALWTDYEAKQTHWFRYFTLLCPIFGQSLQIFFQSMNMAKFSKTNSLMKCSEKNGISIN